jgi:simple sugar transport system ATP-binding protein
LGPRPAATAAPRSLPLTLHLPEQRPGILQPSLDRTQQLRTQQTRQHTPIDKREMRARTAAYLTESGVHLHSVGAKVAVLSGGQRQAIAICRAVHSNSKVLLLDEPLAAMGAREGKLVLDVIRRLKASRQVSIILIAHNYMHLLEVCDRVCLLRNGRIALTKINAETSAEELTAIVGSEYRTG